MEHCAEVGTKQKCGKFENVISFSEQQMMSHTKTPHELHSHYDEYFDCPGMSN